VAGSGRATLVDELCLGGEQTPGLRGMPVRPNGSPLMGLGGGSRSPARRCLLVVRSRAGSALDRTGAKILLARRARSVEIAMQLPAARIP